MLNERNVSIEQENMTRENIAGSKVIAIERMNTTLECKYSEPFLQRQAEWYSTNAMFYSYFLIERMFWINFKAILTHIQNISCWSIE